MNPEQVLFLMFCKTISSQHCHMGCLFYCFKKIWNFFSISFSRCNSLFCFCNFFNSYVELKSAFPCPGNALSPYPSYSLIQRRKLHPLIPSSAAVCATDLSVSYANFTAAILNYLSYTARFIN